MLIVKLERDLQNYMTYKIRYVISNYHVGMLTNPINPTPKPTPAVAVASKQTLRILWPFPHYLGFSCFPSVKGQDGIPALGYFLFNECYLLARYSHDSHT